ncbi:hypothetical protein [Tenacibaculum jejuense]|uniref:Signal peptide-containing protein n=1 Tax=Tenacibaculum jejuense TaxID=584609 RepID=A0A238U5J2_9FLAO|nr:hypothetical protein [Tenacibaculum jejuense]SNR14481.1 Signal peptide-containing protein [Tenacibaculum jejuense]
MNKAIAFILILIIAPFLGSIYGIVHDQITFSIAEEYYTKFKFFQFGLYNWGMGQNMGTSETPEVILNSPRFGAGIIGVLSTWWVGLISGIILGFTGLIHKDGNTMFRITLKAIIYTIIIAFLTGLIGFIYSKINVIENIPNWYLPKNVIHKKDFITVGTIHNFSYLGGLIGLIIGVIYSIATNIAYKKRD